MVIKPPFKYTKKLVLFLVHLEPNVVAGLTVGDPVLRTGAPLSVELGPGTVFLLLYD